MGASRFDRLTRHLGRHTTRRTAMGTALAGLALGGLDHLAAAQDATSAPGATPAAEGEKPVFMFVQTFAAGRGEVNPAAGTPTADGTPVPAGGARFLLTLEDHTGQTVYFSDRPDRIVGATPTGDFLDNLGFSVSNPPNAALVAEFQAGQGVVVLELIEPTYDPDTGTLTYGAEVLAGYGGDNLTPVLAEQVNERLPADFGPTALFIDDCPQVVSCCCFGDGPTRCGPIPGGPYPKCWDIYLQDCVDCLNASEYNDGICHDAYGSSCFAV
jgi:hypothetical protein